jgi:hypothetical protein
MFESDSGGLEKYILKFKLFFDWRLNTETFWVTVADIEPASYQNLSKHVYLIRV